MDGRRWSCGLLRDLEDWDKVIVDERYLKTVQPLYDTVPELKGMNCRDWPMAYPYYTTYLTVNNLFFPDGSCCEEVKEIKE